MGVDMTENVLKKKVATTSMSLSFPGCQILISPTAHVFSAFCLFVVKLNKLYVNSEQC